MKLARGVVVRVAACAALVAAGVIAAACGGGGGGRNHPSDAPDNSQHDDAAHDAATSGSDAAIDAPGSGSDSASMMIGSGGGTLALPDGATLDIPAGALGSDTMIGIRFVSGPAMGAVSNVYELTPDGTQLAVPARLTLPYDPAQLGSAASADNMTIATLSPGNNTGTGWNVVSDGDHRISAFIMHFSQWAIIPMPPAQACTVNYSCFQSCSGAQIPELCCSQGRGTCWAIMHRSFPAFVSCYAGCVGTPNTQNFGNNSCMSACCTGHGFSTTNTGVCYSASATYAEAASILQCARSCTGTSTGNLCTRGNPQLDACAWNVNITPNLGSECDTGVNSQILATNATTVYPQTWGNPAQVDITSGTVSATTLTMAMQCSNGMPYSGTASGTWSGAQYSATWTFGSTSGTMTIAPDW